MAGGYAGILVSPVSGSLFFFLAPLILGPKSILMWIRVLAVLGDALMCCIDFSENNDLNFSLRILHKEGIKMFPWRLVQEYLFSYSLFSCCCVFCDVILHVKAGKFTLGSVTPACIFQQWKMLCLVSLGCYTSDPMCQENKPLKTFHEIYF